MDTIGVERIDSILRGECLDADVVDGVVDKVLSRHQSLDVAVHNERKARVDLADAGRESEADLVAQILLRPI